MDTRSASQVSNTLSTRHEEGIMTAYEYNVGLSDDELLPLMQKAGQYEDIPCLTHRYYEKKGRRRCTSDEGTSGRPFNSNLLGMIQGESCHL